MAGLAVFALLVVAYFVLAIALAVGCHTAMCWARRHVGRLDRRVAPRDRRGAPRDEWACISRSWQDRRSA